MRHGCGTSLVDIVCYRYVLHCEGRNFEKIMRHNFIEVPVTNEMALTGIRP